MSISKSNPNHPRPYYYFGLLKSVLTSNVYELISVLFLKHSRISIVYSSLLVVILMFIDQLSQRVSASLHLCLCLCGLLQYPRGSYGVSALCRDVATAGRERPCWIR